MRARRVITIGEVKPGWFVLTGSCGFPGGFFMAWRGNVSWCQPCEFVHWRHLVWAIGRRLELAGLVLVPHGQPHAGGQCDLAVAPRGEEWVPVTVSVERRVDR